MQAEEFLMKNLAHAGREFVGVFGCTVGVEFGVGFGPVENLCWLDGVRT